MKHLFLEIPLVSFDSTFSTKDMLVRTLCWLLHKDNIIMVTFEGFSRDVGAESGQFEDLMQHKRVDIVDEIFRQFHSFTAVEEKDIAYSTDKTMKIKHFY